MRCSHIIRFPFGLQILRRVPCQNRGEIQGHPEQFVYLKECILQIIILYIDHCDDSGRVAYGGTDYSLNSLMLSMLPHTVDIKCDHFSGWCVMEDHFIGVERLMKSLYLPLLRDPSIRFTTPFLHARSLGFLSHSSPLIPREFGPEAASSSISCRYWIDELISLTRTMRFAHLVCKPGYIRVYFFSLNASFFLLVRFMEVKVK